MERTTPYATPVNHNGRIFWLALAAVGLAGAGVGIGAVAWSRSPTVAPSPVVSTVEAAPPKPAPSTDALPQRSPEIDRLLQGLNESEAQRREDARKAADRVAELERMNATARQDEAARRAEDVRRVTDEAQRRAAELRAQDEARRAEDERRRADDQARRQAAWDAVRRIEADRQAEAQRRAAQALEDERRRIEDARRRTADRRTALPRVTGAILSVDRPTARGTLPQTLRFTGWITADGPATVQYRFVRSDGSTAELQTLTCPAAGRFPVSMTWSLGAPFSGWVALEVAAPNPVTSGRATFTVIGP